jgi:hypothetical protein
MEGFSKETMALIKALQKDATTQGITTATGLQFYYLEPQAKNIYPVFYPLLASTPRVNPMFNGMKVGGNAVNWKAVVGIDANGYPAISEGNRNAYMYIQEKDFLSAYKFLGKDTATTFQAQAMGTGFEDNIALAQLSMLNALLNDEERMLLFGNSGNVANGGNNGYVLGQAVKPTGVQSTTAGTLSAGTYYCYVVALTPWGVHLASSTGVRIPWQRTNADGSTDSLKGGTSKISAASDGFSLDGSHAADLTTTAINGAVGYAWYIGKTNAATAKFAGVTAYPSATITASPTGTNQSADPANPDGLSVGLDADASYNNLDFDGLLTWFFGTKTAAQPAYLADLGGAGFTSNGDGTIKEFEDCLDFLWNNYKITVDKIYLGGSLITSVSKAIMDGGSSGAQRIIFESNAAGAVTGGTKVVQYRSKYSNNGSAKVLDVTTHPWMPSGVVYFDLINNPYPAAGNTIPAVRRIVSLEDHFSLKWPYRALKHELGVYCFETLQHYIPFGGGIITGAKNIVNP